MAAATLPLTESRRTPTPGRISCVATLSDSQKRCKGWWCNAAADKWCEQCQWRRINREQFLRDARVRTWTCETRRTAADEAHAEERGQAEALTTVAENAVSRQSGGLFYW